MKEVKVPSGAELKITLAPFSESKALFQAVTEEVKSLKLDPNAEVDVNFWKDIFCLGISSKRIEQALEPCLKRSTYNGLKIDKDTFESPESREDYLTVCYEVAKENLLPFTKSLYAQYAPILEKLKSGLQ
jgi:hypothetical protein